jgi:UrcA family protein
MTTSTTNLSSKIRRSAFAALLWAVSALALFNEPAIADEVAAVTVNYADLDVSKPAGAQQLYQRIKSAARKVCAPLNGKDLHRMFLWRDCYEQAVADAVATIDRPALSALHQSERSPIS